MRQKATKTSSERVGFDRLSGRMRTNDESEVLETRESNRLGVYLMAATLFCAGFAVVFLATLRWVGAASVIVSTAAGALLAACVRICPQWERMVILRFGRFNRVAGPGPYLVVPLLEYPAARVDQRIRIMSFSAERALTLDLVPVDIDAVIFWLVWDTQKACLEVEDYPKAVLWSAQTAMRDAIGKLSLSELSPNRKQVDTELQKLLSEKCEGWGISVLGVEIRDITVPQELQDALSKEAQAQAERNARMTLAEVEKDISEMLVEAAEVYRENPLALKLRTLNLAYESAKAGKGVLFAPTDLAEGFNCRPDPE